MGSRVLGQYSVNLIQNMTTSRPIWSLRPVLSEEDSHAMLTNSDAEKKLIDFFPNETPSLFGM
jgi:hypothetical protein